MGARRLVASLVAAGAVFLVAPSPALAATCQGEPIPCQYKPFPGQGYCIIRQNQNPSTASFYGENNPNRLRAQSTISVSGGRVTVNEWVTRSYSPGKGWMHVYVFGPGATEVAALLWDAYRECSSGSSCSFSVTSPVLSGIQWVRVVIADVETTGGFPINDVWNHVDCFTGCL